MQGSVSGRKQYRGGCTAVVTGHGVNSHTCSKGMGLFHKYNIDNYFIIRYTKGSIYFGIADFYWKRRRQKLRKICRKMSAVVLSAAMAGWKPREWERQ